MKRWMALVFIVTALSAVWAGQTYYYPNAESPLFSVTLPESWTVETEDPLLHASPSDASIYLGLWAVEIADMDAVGEAVGEIVGELVSDFEIEEEDELEVNGMPMYYFDGTGFDEDGDEIACSVGLFTPDGETFCVILYFGTEAAEMEHGEALNQIIHSLEPPE